MSSDNPLESEARDRVLKALRGACTHGLSYAPMPVSCVVCEALCDAVMRGLHADGPVTLYRLEHGHEDAESWGLLGVYSTLERAQNAAHTHVGNHAMKWEVSAPGGWYAGRFDTDDEIMDNYLIHEIELDGGPSEYDESPAEHYCEDCNDYH